MSWFAVSLLCKPNVFQRAPHLRTWIQITTTRLSTLQNSLPRYSSPFRYEGLPAPVRPRGALCLPLLGANTGGSTTSSSTANQVIWASDCVDSVVSNYMPVLINKLHSIDTDNVTSPANTIAEPTTVGTKTNKMLAWMVLALPCLRGLFRLSLL